MKGIDDYEGQPFDEPEQDKKEDEKKQESDDYEDSDNAGGIELPDKGSSQQDKIIAI